MLKSRGQEQVISALGARLQPEQMSIPELLHEAGQLEGAAEVLQRDAAELRRVAIERELAR